MTRALLLMAVALVACAEPTHVGPAAELDAILVSGQSNAVASVLMLEHNKNVPRLPVGITGPDLMSWNGAELVEADGDAVGKGKHTGHTIGLWAAHLGRHIIDATGEPLAVINRGDGGKAIDFFLPSGANYALMRDHVLASGVRPRAFVISQGESDGSALAATSADAYYARLCEWHAAIAIDYPDAIVIIVGTSSDTCGGDSSQVRSAQSRFAATHAGVTLLDVDDMTGDADLHTGCHYTYAGYMLWAGRIADLL
jgi:hypothetical protein